MAIDRSKFKKTSASQLAQADKELNKTMGKKDKGNGHDIDEGNNLFRIYPVHPDVAEKDPKAVFAVPFVQTFVPAMVKEMKDGKEVLEGGKPKMRKSVRPVVNAKVHGGYPKDLIEEYIILANKNAKDMNLSKEDRKTYLTPIYGDYPKVNGINYPQAWIVYADKYPNANPAATPVFDELKFKKSVKERLNKISAIEAANDPLGTDPFTDIEEGRAIKILKDKEADANNMYSTELDSSTVTELIGNRTVKVQKTYPLTDAQLGYFLKQEPLHEKYGKKLATRKNFEAQLNGLELLDLEWQMGIFDMPEWNNVVAEIDSYYPENDAPNTTPSNDDTEDTSVEEEVVDSNLDEFDLMDRNELKAFAKDNKTGLLIRPSLTDDEVKAKLREWKANNTPLEEEPFTKEQPAAHKVAEVKQETTEEKQAFLDDLNGVKKEETKVVEQPAATGVSAKDRLNALRAKAAQQNAA